jgi:L-threonylcarbamoyladenylate synthase
MPLVSSDVLIEKAIAGRVVSFPTDTLPALAVKPEQSEAIFQLKQRSYEKPLILMTGSIADIWQYVIGTEEELKIWQEMANKYLPGALTMVLPASERIPPTMNPLNPQSIGVRVPNNAIAQNILQQTGALATTSANLSGEAALTKMSAIAEKFPSVYVLDSEHEAISGIASTVIKWTGEDWQILRQGQIRVSS